MRKSIDLEGVINARQLGGFPVQDGRHVKDGLLLRGGNLEKATSDDIAKLREQYRVSRIFDFRTGIELKYSPDPRIEGIEYTWLPTIDPDSDALGTTSLPSYAYRNLSTYLTEHVFDDDVKRVAKNLYRDMVDNEYTQLQYSAFLQMLLNEPGAVYWHCSQGKDRTGLGSAFILTLLGADKSTVIEDYDISNDVYQKDVDELAAVLTAKGAGSAEIAAMRTFIGANTDYFVETLDYIESTYGSLLNYIRNVLLINDADIEAFRNKYLE